MMNFTHFTFSGRTLDLGTHVNWTITSWPRQMTALENKKYASSRLISPYNPHSAKLVEDAVDWPSTYGMVGLSANWFGDQHYEFPVFFGDSLNEKGLSCALLMLLNTQYEERDTTGTKKNVFAGTFCHYIAQNYASIKEVQADINNIVIYGPDLLAQHYILRDASGVSMVIEVMNRAKNVYIDLNDGVTTFGITTNEPTLDWHLENVQHYLWKRTLSRQAVAIPGNFYPEERFLRTHMIKEGMQVAGLMTNTSSYQTAFALTAQVLNSVSVPEGDQYGTDSSDNGGSEGSGDHTCWGIIRCHSDPAIYWRDATNPTFRRIRLKDLDLSVKTKRSMLKLEDGPYFIDMSAQL
jgi:penicillin V acylase-like amidase (Ntn superfamily)